MRPSRTRDGQLDPAQQGRLVAILAKADPPATGRIRGNRHIMLDDSDINATRHARALVGGVLAAVTGRTDLPVSDDAEHQGPDSGGFVAAIVRFPEAEHLQGVVEHGRETFRTLHQMNSVIPPARQDFGAAAERFFLEDWPRRLRTPLCQAIFLIMAVMLAAFLSYEAVSNQITETGLLHEDRVNLPSYLSGTTDRPFVFRVVTPALINFAEHTLGAPALVAALPAQISGKIPLWCALPTTVAKPTCDNIAAYVLVASGYCFCFLMLIYAACLRLFGNNPVIAELGIVFAFLEINAVMLMGLSHVYDFGVLMFATLLILCLERQWNIAFTLLLPLAFLTKETLIIYGGAFFVVNLGRIPFSRLAGLSALQLMSFLVLHGWVRAHFAGNAGGGHEYYLPDQIIFFTQEVSLSRLLPMILLFALMFYDFSRKQIVLRRSCIVFLPWLTVAMLFGYKKEVRIAMEVLPLVALLCIDTLVQMAAGRGSAGMTRPRFTS